MAETQAQEYPTRDEVAEWVQSILDAQPDASSLASGATSAQVDALASYVADGVGVVRADTAALSTKVDELGAVVAGLARSDGTATSVRLVSSQYEELRGVVAAEVGGTVVVIGLLALVLGVLVGIVITRRWGA